MVPRDSLALEIYFKLLTDAQADGTLITRAWLERYPRGIAWLYATQLPLPVRAPFIAGFSNAARQGFEVGAGQSGTALQLPPGVPTDLAAQIGQVAHALFTHAFVDAMHPSMALALAVVAAGAIVSLFARQPHASDTRMIAEVAA